MDFFGHQDQARRASGRLVWLFVAAVVCIIVLIYVAAKATLVIGDVGREQWIDWPVLGAVAGAVVLVVGGAMAFKTAQLRSGGGTVAEMMGGRLVDINPTDPQEKVLRNVVEEMAIASGTPVPEIYVLDHEQGINAFAAGWSPSDAAVAVTRGSLDSFTRDELQGVIAHEFSHVFHGDMRLNIRLMGTLFGIVCLAVVGRIVLRGGFYSGAGRSNDRRGNNGGVMIFGLALIVIGYVGVFFARLIQAAVSRQREYLADASAVQYTRNPRGIGMALARIGGLGGKLQTAHAEEASHMLFANGISNFGGALATHPPLEQRIERVLPGFLKKLEESDDMVHAVDETPVPSAFADGAAAGFAGGTRPTDLVATIGDPQPQHVAAAFHLLDELPLDLTAASHEPERAPALVLALLLDEHDESVRDRQLQLVREQGTDRLRLDTRALHEQIGALARGKRLPLFELAVPTLRRAPIADRMQIRSLARQLALADDHLSAFEFALLKSLERHVRAGDEHSERPRGRPESLLQHRRHVVTVMSVIAHAGADGDADKAAAAFARGARMLSLADAELIAGDRATPAELDAAIDGLNRVSPFGKRNLISACAEIAADDGHLDADEVDLIRALAELWDCPIPLSLPAAGSA